MSDAPQPEAPEATPSPIPRRPKAGKSGGDADQHAGGGNDATQLSSPLPMPKLRLEIRDIAHDGAAAFFRMANPRDLLSDTVSMVLQTLYFGPRGGRHFPPVRSITLVLRPMDGVAYTTGNELDNEHKEIHFSLDHIARQDAQHQEAEVRGVLAHEMVHVWQWNGKGTCPGGLIEGIADFVRLRDGLAPPHWEQKRRDRWDGGYEATAYFLNWLEKRFGDGKIKEMNLYLGEHKYYEEAFWRDIYGRPVGELWQEFNSQFPEDEAEQ